MAGFVWAFNPATGGVARHSEQAHDELWSRLGFELVEVDLDAASQELTTPFGDAGQLPEDYVRSVALRAESRNNPPEEPPDPAPLPSRRSTPAKEA